MSARVLVPLVSLLVGGGVGFAACWFTRPAPTPVTEKPAAGDEVVVEVRVRLPAGAVQPVGAHHSASSVRQGALLNTGEPFDLAIEGAGFFQLTLPNGESAYTRGGAFGVNPQGHIVTKQGHLLVPQVTVPPDAVNVAVGADGTVCMTNAAGQSSSLGQLTLATFINPGWLDRDEHGFWRETTGSGCPHICTPGEANCGLIRQGFRERQASLDAALLTDLVREIVREEHVRVRVER